MLDLSYFQNSGNVNTQTFTNAGYWVTWVKPKGAKFVNVFCMGSGAGGGGGFQVNSAVRTGGAGGGSGGIVNAQFQASVLPDILYIYTGIGGAGGTGGAAGIVTAGGSGEKSYICLTPSTASVSNIVVTSGNVAAIGGQSGSAATAPSRNGESQATTANAIFLNLGTFTATQGSAGGASNSSTPTSTAINYAGSGGGNIAGGTNVAVAANGPFPVTTPSATGGTGATNAQNGKNGYMLTKPILGFMGGNGGGGIASAGTGAGGNGGNGNYGSGGGGGGSAQTGIPGNGGNGGDGIVIITTSF